MRTLSMIFFATLGGAFAVGPAVATTTVCVTSVNELQAALTAAESSTTTTFVDVARGTYHLGGSQLTFLSQAAGQGQLDITGGYNSNCSTVIKNPAFTVIDADNMSGVLSVTSSAGVSVRYLTIQNGLKTNSAGLVVISSAGSVFIDYNIIRNNRSTGATAGLLLVLSGSGNAHVDGNLIVGNSAITNVSGGDVENDGSGDLYITNNTVANNTITGPLVNGYGGLFVSGNTFVSNNIFWGNTSQDFFAFDADLVDNDYGTLGGPPHSNIGSQSVDPQFSSPTDFHLLPTSSLLDAGTLNPAGNLPTIDIEGRPRSYNGFVDMGAYEHGDEIYGGGFDD